MARSQDRLGRSIAGDVAASRAIATSTGGLVMSIIRFRSSTSLACMQGLLALVLAAAPACGDDRPPADDDDGDADDGDDDDDDGDVDAGDDDGGEMTRSAVVAVTETTITNMLPLVGGPRGAPPRLSGGVMSMSYIDDQTVTVAPDPDFDSNINRCAITVFDLKGGDVVPTAVDEGTITVTGTSHGEFACGHSDEAGEYVCQSTDPILRGGVAGNAAGAALAATGELTLGEKIGPEMIGMHIQLSGFDGDTDGVHAVVGVTKAGEPILGNVEADATGGDDATYTTFVGQGPMLNLGTVNVLDDGISKDAQDVVISKEDSDLVPGFTMTARARGEGFTLTKESTQPHEFPATAEDVTFACDGAGCGDDPKQAAGHLDALVINGVTTDVLPAKGDDGLTMLPAENSFATFACSMIGANEITIPADGVELILGTSPARVQITVGRFVAQLNDTDTSSTTVVLGHSLTGFTTLAK
jgi:hypothetical protein